MECKRRENDAGGFGKTKESLEACSHPTPWEKRYVDMYKSGVIAWYMDDNVNSRKWSNDAGAPSLSICPGKLKNDDYRNTYVARDRRNTGSKATWANVSGKTDGYNHVQAAKVVRGSRRWLMMDSDIRTLALQGTVEAPAYAWKNSPKPYQRISFRHNNGGNILYFDSHVEWDSFSSMDKRLRENKTKFDAAKYQFSASIF